MGEKTKKKRQETRLAPEPLTTCPKCTYALKGLPSTHRCPECGFEYDEYSWSWRMPEKKWRRLRKVAWVWMFYPCIFSSFQLLKYFRGIFTSAPSSEQLGWIGAYLLFLAFCIRWLYYIDERPILVVTNNGITFRGRAGIEFRTKFVRRISWQHLADVGQGAGLHKGSYWLLRDNGRQIEMRHYVSNSEEWEVLKKALLDAKAHYTNQDRTSEK